MNNPIAESDYPHFFKIVDEILRQWPQHERYLRTNIAERELLLFKHSERLSKLVFEICAKEEGKLKSIISDYRYLCEEIILPEEIYFRRNGRYRRSRFEDALSEVYNDSAFMTRYMNGLLITEVIWINHCRCMLHYVDQFLPSLPPSASLLEIGPGHGLLLYLASSAKNVDEITAWDVSEASLHIAAHTMGVMKVERPVNFEKRNIFETVEADFLERFDGVVLSEVLEHLENPTDALAVLFQLCKPGGKVWINVPANSPAPDHLYLVNEPAQAVQLVTNAGFKVIDAASYPMSGVTLERAIRQKLTISCIVVGCKPVA